MTEGALRCPAGHAHAPARRQPGTITAVQVLLALGAGSQVISAMTALGGLSLASSLISAAPGPAGDAQAEATMAGAHAAAVLVICWSLAMAVFDVWALVAVGARRCVARLLVTFMPLPAAVVNAVGALLLDGGGAGALAGAAMALPFGLTLAILLWLPASSREHFEDPGRYSRKADAPSAHAALSVAATSATPPSPGIHHRRQPWAGDIDPATTPLRLHQPSGHPWGTAAALGGRHGVTGPGAPSGSTRLGVVPGRASIVAVGAVLALVFAGVTVTVVASSGGGLQPCEASARTPLVGFDGVVGPLPAPEEMTQYLGDEAGFCRYTQGGAVMAQRGVVGSSLLLGRVPRAAVERDRTLSAEFHADVSSRTSSSSSASYPMTLVESGVTAVVHPSTIMSGVDTVIVNCATSNDYWNIQVASTGRDDSVALDTLLTAMSCGPSTP